MKLKYIIAVLSVAFLSFFVFAIGNEYVTMKEEIQILQEKKDNLQEDFNKTLNKELLKGYMNEIPEDVEPGYQHWENANLVADYAYEDSEGLFHRDWALFLAVEAERREIDPLLVYELIKVETGGTFDPELVGPETSYGHAYGLAQFMKNTGPWIADMAGLPYDDALLFDPYYSIQLSVVYLDFLYQHYGDWNHALTAYHRGMYGLEQFVNENGHAESWYAVLIQENANHDIFAYGQ
ncbi:MULTISPECIES: lytic transglycosylase domain-containing protein [Bacillaceae]|uniref:Transglycosylase SLT domain-containing protein n=1 Tax=Evansella alkalicola TaxID=745819 RepID=A0ABS6JZ34_9BACI|nr:MULTISPECIES: transglycosylase SLT domain-containing protein [Bacillaceae]MBU9722472.1 transglycosylase SLT domain-containing protein [Bacillus alkalicola]